MISAFESYDVGEMAKKNAVAQALVAMRNKKLTPARRKEIAQKAAAARWKKAK
jgi:hypothetical protein